MESSGAVVAAEDALRKDPAWWRALQERSSLFGDTPAGPNFRLCLYRSPIGSGRTLPVGAGMRRGPWQSFGIRDGFPVGMTHAILQDRTGDLWFATNRGVCRCEYRQDAGWRVEHLLRTWAS